jgi:hypothetical protein
MRASADAMTTSQARRISHPPATAKPSTIATETNGAASSRSKTADSPRHEALQPLPVALERLELQ